MQRMSHSLHISSGKHSISTSAKLSSADKHNNRKFTNSNNENLNLKISKLNTTLIGSNNIFNDVKELYTELFETSVQQFNAKQKDKSRKIDNYMNKISNSSKQNIAEEIIVQFGSMNNNDIYLEIEDVGDVDLMKNMFNDYLVELQKQIPNFKIANATIHFDEANPHLHVIGVPISENNKKGLSTKVSKRSVFNRETLSKLQTNMGQLMTELVKDYLGYDVYYEKEKGRNRDYNTTEILELKEVEKQLKNNIEELEENYQELYSKYNTLYSAFDRKKKKLQDELKEVFEVDYDRLSEEYFSNLKYNLEEYIEHHQEFNNSVETKLIEVKEIWKRVTSNHEEEKRTPTRKPSRYEEDGHSL